MNKDSGFVVYFNDDRGTYTWSYRSGDFSASPWEKEFSSVKEAIDHFCNQGREDRKDSSTPPM